MAFVLLFWANDSEQTSFLGQLTSRDFTVEANKSIFETLTLFSVCSHLSSPLSRLRFSLLKSHRPLLSLTAIRPLFPELGWMGGSPTCFLLSSCWVFKPVPHSSDWTRACHAVLCHVWSVLIVTWRIGRKRIRFAALATACSLTPHWRHDRAVWSPESRKWYSIYGKRMPLAHHHSKMQNLPPFTPAKSSTLKCEVETFSFKLPATYLRVKWSNDGYVSTKKEKHCSGYHPNQHLIQGTVKFHLKLPKKSWHFHYFS